MKPMAVAGFMAVSPGTIRFKASTSIDQPISASAPTTTGITLAPFAIVRRVVATRGSVRSGSSGTLGSSCASPARPLSPMLMELSLHRGSGTKAKGKLCRDRNRDWPAAASRLLISGKLWRGLAEGGGLGARAGLGNTDGA
jgi:hypothetical protein